MSSTLNELRALIKAEYAKYEQLSCEFTKTRQRLFAAFHFNSQKRKAFTKNFRLYMPWKPDESTQSSLQSEVSAKDKFGLLPISSVENEYKFPVSGLVSSFFPCIYFNKMSYVGGQVLSVHIKAPIGWLKSIREVIHGFTTDVLLQLVTNPQLYCLSENRFLGKIYLFSQTEFRYGQMFASDFTNFWLECFHLPVCSFTLDETMHGKLFQLKVDIPGVCHIFSVPFRYFHHRKFTAFPPNAFPKAISERFSSVISTISLPQVRKRALDQIEDRASFLRMKDANGFRRVVMNRSLPSGIRVRITFFDSEKYAKEYLVSVNNVNNATNLGSSHSIDTFPPNSNGSPLLPPKSLYTKPLLSSSNEILMNEYSSRHSLSSSYSSGTLIQNYQAKGKKLAKFVSWESSWCNLLQHMNDPTSLSNRLHKQLDQNALCVLQKVIDFASQKQRFPLKPKPISSSSLCLNIKSPKRTLLLTDMNSELFRTQNIEKRKKEKNEFRKGKKRACSQIKMSMIGFESFVINTPPPCPRLVPIEPSECVVEVEERECEFTHSADYIQRVGKNETPIETEDFTFSKNFAFEQRFDKGMNTTDEDFDIEQTDAERELNTNKSTLLSPDHQSTNFFSLECYEPTEHIRDTSNSAFLSPSRNTKNVSSIIFLPSVKPVEFSNPTSKSIFSTSLPNEGLNLCGERCHSQRRKQKQRQIPPVSVSPFILGKNDDELDDLTSNLNVVTFKTRTLHETNNEFLLHSPIKHKTMSTVPSFGNCSEENSFSVSEKLISKKSNSFSTFVANKSQHEEPLSVAMFTPTTDKTNHETILQNLSNKLTFSSSSSSSSSSPEEENSLLTESLPWEEYLAINMNTKRRQSVSNRKFGALLEPQSYHDDMAPSLSPPLSIEVDNVAKNIELKNWFEEIAKLPLLN